MFNKRLFLVLSLLTMSAGLQACTWDDKAYSKYVNNGSVTECNGVCINNISDQANCVQSKGLWMAHVCRDVKGNVVDLGESFAKEDCTKDDGNFYEEGYCKILNQEDCKSANGSWGDYAIYDLGKGRYARHVGDKYICGRYNEIVDVTSNNDQKPCSSDELNIVKESIEKNICTSDSNYCVAIYSKTSVVGMCSHCGENQVSCDDTNTCYDLTSNSLHCGACGNQCGENEACRNGFCKKIADTACKETQIRCSCTSDGENISCLEVQNENELKENEFCLDPSQNANCGITDCKNVSKESVCGDGVNCVQNETTHKYECKCDKDSYLYNGTCVSPYSPKTCGINEDNPSSVTICDEDISACNGISCVCVSPYKACSDPSGNSVCVNLNNDSKYCGSCSNSCSNGEECVESECVCKEGNIICKDGDNSVCVDPNNSMKHCGARGNCTDENDGSSDVNSSGVECLNSVGCVDGKCVCEEDAIKIGDQCVKSSDDLYCGATADVDGERGQNCTEIEGAKCSDAGSSAKCICPGKTPIYDRNDNKFLISCVDPQSDTHYCGYDQTNDSYTDCDLICQPGENDSYCNKDKSEESDVWTCINGVCKNTCPSDTIKCRKRCETGDDCSPRYMCVNANEAKFIDGTEYCECLTCDDDNDATTGCSGVSVGESVNHCTACNVKCNDAYELCVEDDSTPELSTYKCVCGNDKTEVISESGQVYCLDVEKAHLVKDNNTWKCVDGYADLVNGWSDGCETHIYSDKRHCGKTVEQVKDCTSLENVAAVSCIDGVCQIESCDSGYEQCGKDSACNTNVNTSINNCRFCKNTCSLACYDDDDDECENKCEGKCCQEGELSSKIGKDVISCCNGTKLFKYSYKIHILFWKSCYHSSHYGCFEENPNTTCWTEVTD